MVHDSPGWRRRGQSSFSRKPAPLADTPFSRSGCVETLVSVTGEGSLSVPKSAEPRSSGRNGDGVSSTADPVPCKAAARGLLSPCAGTVSVPVIWPATVGLKLTNISQELCGWTTLPQSLVWEKLVLVWISPIGTGMLPTLMSDNPTDEDVVPSI